MYTLQTQTRVVHTHQREELYACCQRHIVWISILAIPVGTVIPQAPVRVGRMCSWPMLQAPDTVSGGHMAATRA